MLTYPKNGFTQKSLLAVASQTKTSTHGSLPWLLGLEGRQAAGWNMDRKDVWTESRRLELTVNAEQRQISNPFKVHIWCHGLTKGFTTWNWATDGCRIQEMSGHEMWNDVCNYWFCKSFLNCRKPESNKKHCFPLKAQLQTLSFAQHYVTPLSFGLAGIGFLAKDTLTQPSALQSEHLPVLRIFPARFEVWWQVTLTCTIKTRSLFGWNWFLVWKEHLKTNSS